MSNKKMGLTTKIFIGLIIGLIVGLILNKMGPSYFRDTILVNGIFELVGRIFLNGIRMMVVPLVFISLANGAASMSDIKKLGRVGSKTMAFYLITTAVAITIAIILASVVNPGVGLDMSSLVKTEPTIAESKPLVKVITDMVPTNPVAAMAAGEMLQIIVFALLFGTGLAAIGKKVQPVIDILDQLNDLMMKMVSIVMLLAPYGVFCLIAKTFSGLGFAAMAPLAKYMLCVLGALAIHAGLTYTGMLVAFTKLNPITFFKKFSPAMSVAFSTASSGATLPVTLEVVEEKLGVNKAISSFTIPLGATINMDGTAIMQGAATIFIAQVYGIDLGLNAILTVILTATLASVGTAGVPGVGLIMLSMVLQAVGLPIEGIALIIGIDRILDMARTAINITGDAVCTLIIAKSEGELNEAIYNAEVEEKSIA
ncbi:Na+/H+-dicarboxylate symporter [Geosporobacter subterraneus DSM 17957]|uniref:Na+/H+-dicarboxylate symporter n=1 Tax=Geosporobacter subterraneus DSM 17957 TaxID=1121919 RepID=A0A1M6FUM9_9FIRM|nr:dicarboxylate/amino acid:cation symporter [Geosporobacter subterraneus]SHJ01395.1 Na+/H+-dicarboxylate symporter [Geosporobacter subterraneus DSM 17957]